ncbi:reverse transcriptase domain protein [Colletotrichum truncatum]|uniref:Reverse transcriptase domain protein n=1 Tax=Colletotrichum truncatum TaxID=5467 RepID=A0ACC3Z2H1_COLTU
MSQNDFKTVFTPLPRLKGESNWNTWRMLVTATLRGYDFEIFLETDVPRPADPIAAEEWRKNRNVTNGLLMNASESVLDRLCTAGWVDDGNPYELWQALEKHIPRISQDATAALVDEFAKTTANDHKTLHDALNRCHHLRKRIETIHGRLPDSFLAVFLLNFFKDRLPDTYKHFTSKGATHPTWNEVADTIYTLAQDEDQKRSYATIRNTPGGKSAGSGGPASPAVTTTVTSTVTASKEKKKCDHCNCDHETTKCYVAHPNLIPLHYVNRDKLIEKARKHVCGDRCRWDQPTSVDGTRQTVVRASPAILGQSALASIASPAVFTAARDDLITRDDIVLDSGCTTSTFNNLRYFVKYAEKSDLTPSTSASGAPVRSLGVGTVFFQTQDPTNPDVIHDWTLHNVEYNPSSPANLLSPGKLRRDHVEYDWQTSSLIHVTQRTSLAKVHWVSDVCVVETHDTGNHVPRDIAVSLAAFRATQRPSLELMHRRLVHAHPSRVVEACRRVGIRFTTSEIDAFFCESCHLSKSTERISRDHPLPLTSIGDEIHLDLVGVLPLSTKGNRQVLHLMDKYSGYHWVVFLPNHKFATILAAIKKWDTEFYSLTGLKPKVWVSDNAPELIKVFNDPYFEGTRHNTTIAYTPSMNGTIERAGRTIVEGARTQLIDMSLPEELWDYSIDSVTQILNLLPTPSKGNLSPHEIMARELNLAAEREAPHIEHLRTFGCAAYVHKKGPRRPMRSAKMEPRAIKGFLVGYGSLRGHIYYVYLPDRKEVIRCRDVRFREEPHKTVLPPTTGTPNIDEIEHDAAFVEPDIIIQYTIRQKPIEGEKPVTGDPKPDETIVEKAMAPTDTHLMSPPPENLLETTATPRDSITNELNDDEFVASVETMETDHQDPDSLSTIVEEATSQPAESSRPRRASAQRPPGHYRAASGVRSYAKKTFLSADIPASLTSRQFSLSVLSATALSKVLPDGVVIPKSYREAQKSPQWPQWEQAFEREMTQFTEKGVYEVVYPPRDAKVLPGKWVCDIKTNKNNEIVRYKARYVVCGNHEKGDWSSQEVYAAVASATATRLFFAVVALLDLEYEVYDFDTAFLAASIPEGVKVYVRPPAGYATADNKVWLLHKALYGLRKSPLWWFRLIKGEMERIGFTAVDGEVCLFVNHKIKAYVLMYVDDNAIAAPNKQVMMEVRRLLEKVCSLKDLGEATDFLGFQIERDRAAGKIFVSKAKYAKAVLQRFDFDGLSAVKTPMATTDDLPVTWDKNECSLDEQQLYIEQTGCLNFLVAGTRVDMAYTVSKLSQANSGPSKAHLRAIKHLFRYLKGTVYLGIVLGGIPTINELGLYAAADASFADNKPSRVSTGGYVVFLAGAPIAWKSKKQTFVTLSTTEAEFINLTPTAIAVKWIRRCLSQLLGKPITTPTIMFTDSANGYDNVMNPLNEARTRHIDVRYKWIIQEVHTAKSIELRLIKGADMAADGLTKPLVAVKHKEFVRLLGMAEGLD